MTAIETTELTKRYEDTLAVDDLALSIPESVVYGFLGPNGAGKTTTMRMFTGLTHPSSGTGSVAGVSITDRDGLRTHIGYLPGEPPLYEQATATTSRPSTSVSTTGSSTSKPNKASKANTSTRVSRARSSTHSKVTTDESRHHPHPTPRGGPGWSPRHHHVPTLQVSTVRRRPRDRPCLPPSRHRPLDDPSTLLHGLQSRHHHPADAWLYGTLSPVPTRHPR
ncbi:ATP-binding cassette domain-containing protein [Natrialba aegyptia]|uniref:ABC-type multidrug transport system, ATPase component n=1 Tax=Natrialba aegyptia DSM 13077 TaxID=1227491 RepID=M0AVC8_9EURY|nr:ATP-binding cassette domain-containing protein [Natrialba aegyptia]ELZ01349.1 ABC-type multidrug transport system, ATPase component [Natrialba aegyptia DSM 13077]